MTAIETGLGVVTVSPVEPEIPPSDAEIFVEPPAIPLTNPDVLTVAIPAEEEFHPTSTVISALLPSV